MKEIETYVVLQPGETKGRDDLGYGRIILKWILNTVVCTELFLLKNGTIRIIW
jgi:hypothetical protein